MPPSMPTNLFERARSVLKKKEPSFDGAIKCIFPTDKLDFRKRRFLVNKSIDLKKRQVESSQLKESLRKSVPTLPTSYATEEGSRNDPMKELLDVQKMRTRKYTLVNCQHSEHDEPSQKNVETQHICSEVVSENGGDLKCNHDLQTLISRIVQGSEQF